MRVLRSRRGAKVEALARGKKEAPAAGEAGSGASPRPSQRD